MSVSRCARFILGRPCPGGAVTFSCLPKKKVTKKKGTPVRRSPCWATPPALLAAPASDSNSRDPLRGHALKHESADCPRCSCATRRLAGAPKASQCEQPVYVIHGSHFHETQEGFCSASTSTTSERGCTYMSFAAPAAPAARVDVIGRVQRRVHAAPPRLPVSVGTAGNSKVSGSQ